MKRFFLTLLSILILLFIPSSVLAQNDSETQEHIILPEGEVVDKDYFATSEAVTLSGVVNGDAYLFGGVIIMEGEVNGDLIVAGGQVTIRGKVSEDVRVAGGQVTVSGQVGRSLTAVGGNVEVTDAATINGSLVGAGGNVSIFAPVGKGVKLGAGNVVVGSTIGGDVEAGVGLLTLTSRADVGGDITYWSNTQANVHEGAKVKGALTQNTPPEGFSASPGQALAVVSGINLFFQIIALISSFIIGFLLIRFLPSSTQRVINILEKRPWPSLGFGLLTLIVTPIVIFLLLIIILTIPIALILLAAYLIALYLTRIYVSYFIGKKILSQLTKKEYELWALLLGLVIFGAISLIPIIGGIFVFLATIFGLGAVYFKVIEEYREARDKNII